MTQNQGSEQVYRPGFGWVERPVTVAEVVEIKRDESDEDSERQSA